MPGLEDSLARLYAQAKRGGSGFTCEQIRDLTKIGLGNGFALVVAVDSDGGIGSREHDVVKVPEYVLGRFAIRVPLMEILSCGAVPLAAFNMLTVPMDERGSEIVRGVRDELTQADLGPEFPLSGSTEDNVPTSVTGIGASVLGVVHRNDFRPGSSGPGDVVLCLGVPKSAPDDEITLDEEEIVRPEHIRAVGLVEQVRDILPVGSRGIWYEARQMAESAGLRFVESPEASIDGQKSAGPSTCVLVSVTADSGTSAADGLGIPVTEIGALVES
jgi:hypothetical protein